MDVPDGFLLLTRYRSLHAVRQTHERLQDARLLPYDRQLQKIDISFMIFLQLPASMLFRCHQTGYVELFFQCAAQLAQLRQTAAAGLGDSHAIYSK